MQILLNNKKSFVGIILRVLFKAFLTKPYHVVTHDFVKYFNGELLLYLTADFFLNLRYE